MTATRRPATRALLLLAIALPPVTLAACATTPRFEDAPVVWRADDRRDIPRPEPREYLALRYFGDIFAMRRLTRALELPDADPAGDTNALDEVPDSTWFTNRIGARDLAPAEVAIGPATAGPPQLPLRITSGKTGGGNPGFVVEDAAGRRFLLKFDTLENPEMQTATSVIVNRFLWTAGYNVPSDTILFFERHELRLAPDATTTDERGRERALTTTDLADTLARVPRLPDGRFRASASELLAGEPVGGFAPEGTRPDDPNDRVPHEDRRTLRGLRALAAWLNHTDMKEDNTLDVWVDGGDTRYLVHYLLDFGEALGAHQAEKGRLDDGYEYAWDWGASGLRLVTFGLW
jgi:hypothetical protein